MFGKMQQMREMQKQAQELKKQMETEIIEYEKDGIKIVMNGAQELQSISFDDDFDFGDKEKVGEQLKNALNKATKESQKTVAKKMRGMMGDLGM
ncbi:YbaB/EbfC family DNA-binding protein [Patescibacteria group bacterium]|nr:MAG: YbaB/EbfC family DNA-binding protein [Patescibacteria group bacterium]